MSMVPPELDVLARGGPDDAVDVQLEPGSTYEWAATFPVALPQALADLVWQGASAVGLGVRRVYLRDDGYTLVVELVG
jgi:hypothetical protein